MWLVHAALRRPITVMVAIIAIALCSVLALTRMPIDIFPNLNLPIIYVAQPYGGMSPAQMEGYLTYYYEYNFLYIAGLESVESKLAASTIATLLILPAIFSLAQEHASRHSASLDASDPNSPYAAATQ